MTKETPARQVGGDHSYLALPRMPVGWLIEEAQP